MPTWGDIGFREGRIALFPKCSANDVQLSFEGYKGLHGPIDWDIVVWTDPKDRDPDKPALMVYAVRADKMTVQLMEAHANGRVRAGKGWIYQDRFSLNPMELNAARTEPRALVPEHRQRPTVYGWEHMEIDQPMTVKLVKSELVNQLSKAIAQRGLPWTFEVQKVDGISPQTTKQFLPTWKVTRIT